MTEQQEELSRAVQASRERHDVLADGHEGLEERLEQMAATQQDLPPSAPANC